MARTVLTKITWNNISNTGNGVLHQYIQTPKRKLKTGRAAEYFWRHLRCLVRGWNDVSSVWYIIAIKTKRRSKIDKIYANQTGYPNPHGGDFLQLDEILVSLRMMLPWLFLTPHSPLKVLEGPLYPTQSKARPWSCTWRWTLFPASTCFCSLADQAGFQSHFIVGS